MTKLAIGNEQLSTSAVASRALCRRPWGDECPSPDDMASLTGALTGLPHEILHNILQWVEPVDLARLSRTCHILHRFISENRALFKDILLQRLASHLYLSFRIVKLTCSPGWTI